MTDLDLDVIEARYNDWYERGYNDIPLTDEDASTLYPHGDYGDETRSHYIVRNDVPGLVAEVRRLRERLDEERRGAERLSQWYNAAQAECDAAVAEAARVREALQAVRELHAAGGYGQCALDGGIWPCASVRALDAALHGAE